LVIMYFFFLIFNTTHTLVIYTLSLHDALPISKLFISFSNRAEAQVKKIFKLPEATVLKNSIQFFPEGGNLLIGNINKIAIKTLKPDGLGAESQTHILTTTGDTAATIKTNILGMGSAPLFIQGTQPMIAYTTFDDGTTIKSELPQPVSSGYNIQVNNANSDKLFAQVCLSPDKQDGSE